jgi:Icc-related predicted phosphoesterase
MNLRVVAISDTHGQHCGLKIPEADLLIHAGDICLYGNVRELEAFNDWAAQLDMPVVCIAGNHDIDLEVKPDKARAVLADVIYLQDEEATVAGLRIYGAPWSPTFFNWSFMLDRGAPIREKWEKIPHGLDILITHGPPAYKCDRTNGGLNVGCQDLREIVYDRLPRYHVFGHIHPGHSISMSEHTTFINASICNDQLNPIYQPTIFHIEPSGNRSE